MNSAEDSEWVVRVGDKEYGPASLATLLEWRSEGRLLATNEARRAESDEWMLAGAVPGLFAPPPVPIGESRRSPLERKRTFSETIRDSLRIYRQAFLPFFLTACLVAVPTLILELTSPSYGLFPKTELGFGITVAKFVALLAVVLLVTAWPIFLAAMQLATMDVLRGVEVRVLPLWQRAVALFPRFALLSALVYGSYLFWTLLPLIAMFSLVGASPNLVTLLLILLLLLGQVFMVGRLFVNFLFWQQAAAVSGRDGGEAIAESKMLARSQRRPKKIDRPLWRGVLLSSIWFAIVLGMSAGADLPAALSKLQQATTPEQMMALWQSLNNPQAADPAMIAGTVISSFLHTLLRPLLAIGFVLLYFDARTDFTEEELESPPAPGQKK